MIISYICGGLGNQMFQYAAGRRLADKLGVPLKLDLRDYRGGRDVRPDGLTEYARPVKLYELSVTAPAASDAEIERLRDPYSRVTTVARIVRQVRKRLAPGWLWPASHFVEKTYTFDPAVLGLPDDTYLDGFWQSYKYFEDDLAAVRSEFATKDRSIPAYANSYVDDLRKAGDPVVSVHVRRGDLAHAAEKLGSSHNVHGLPTGLPYLKTAMGMFPKGYRFLVFSDTAADIAWCKANLVFDEIGLDRLHFSEGHTDHHDMALMAACDHNVIANSTFSWWAAYLNQTPGRRVIAPRVWTHQTGPKHMVPDTLVPPDWELI